jgi:hypothetical protein
MRLRTLERDPTLKEIMQSQFRMEQLFKPGTNENRRNGYLVHELCDYYEADPPGFTSRFAPIEEHVRTHLSERVVRRVGYLKAKVGFSSESRAVQVKAEFSEPKKKKFDMGTPVKIVSPGKKNKRALF